MLFKKISRSRQIILLIDIFLLKHDIALLETFQWPPRALSKTPYDFHGSSMGLALPTSPSESSTTSSLVCNPCYVGLPPVLEQAEFSPIPRPWCMLLIWLNFSSLLLDTGMTGVFLLWGSELFPDLSVCSSISSPLIFTTLIHFLQSTCCYLTQILAYLSNCFVY